MDEPDINRIILGEENNEAVQEINIFPEVIWRLIVDKLDNTKDYCMLRKTFPCFHHLFTTQRTKALFGDVMRIITRRIEDRRGTQNQNLQLPNLPFLRRVCKIWNYGVDSALQNLSYNYKFSHEHKLPDSQFIEDLDYEFGYRFQQLEDYEQFDNHFYHTHVLSSKNPFITRRIIVTMPIVSPDILNVLSSSCVDMLENFGKHVWYLHFEAEMTSKNPEALSVFRVLRDMLCHLPNLRVLRIDPLPTRLVVYTVRPYDDRGNPTSVPRIPVVEIFHQEVANNVGRGKEKPQLFTVDGVDTATSCVPLTPHPMHAGPSCRMVFSPPPANLRVPAVQILQPNSSFGGGNSWGQNRFPNQAGFNVPCHGFWGGPGQPARPVWFVCNEENVDPDAIAERNRTISEMILPRLPDLRYVDQGEMPFDMMLKIVQSNLSSIIQLGVNLLSLQEYCQFFQLSMVLTKLWISMPTLKVQWNQIFSWLESRFGQTLENLHVWLPSLESLNGGCQLNLRNLNVGCQLNLRNLKILHLVLDDPVPLDFLLGMSNNLEELYVRLRRMNRGESVRVQRAERMILFYQHLDELTCSNVWLQFPKLRRVRVSSHVEIITQTPYWERTRKQWKDYRALYDFVLGVLQEIGL